MPDYTGPLPVPTPETQPFWDARSGATSSRCRAAARAARFFFYPRARVPALPLGRPRLEAASAAAARCTPSPSCSAGRRASRSRRRTCSRSSSSTEGPRMMTNLVGIDADPGAAPHRHAGRGGVRGRDSDEIALPHFRRREPRREPRAARHARPRRHRRRGRGGRARQAAAQVGLHAARRGGAERARRRGSRAVRTSTRSSAPVSGWRSETAEYLGIRPRYIDGTQIGGCSFIAHVQHAMAAIDGRRWSTSRSSRTARAARRASACRARASAPTAFRMQFEQPVRARRTTDGLRAGGDAPHARVRHHQRAARRAGGLHAASGRS